MTALITKVMQLLRRLSALLTLLFMTACATAQLNWQSLKTQIRNQFPAVEHITTADFKENYSTQALVIDVRNADEFAVSHISGAVHSQDPEQIAALIKQQPDRPTVVYCSVGYRSARMAQSLKQQGLTQVFNLEGSLFEWANQGEPIVTETGPAEKVHPFNEKWGQLLDAEFHP